MSRAKANALLLLAALIWGSAFVAQAHGMRHFGPWTFSGLRFLLGALVVLPLAWRERPARPPAGRTAPTRAQRLAATMALGALLTAGVVLQQIGIVGTTVTNAGFLTVLYVPLVPLVAWAWTRRPPRAAVWPAVAACLLGTWWLTGASWRALSVGDRWVLASVLPWTLHVALLGVVARELGTPLRLACGQFVVCGVVATAAGAVLESWHLPTMRDGLGALAYAGVMSVGVAFTLQVVAQRHTRAADAAILLSSETLFAALAGALVMGDRLPAIAWVGAALIGAGIMVVNLWGEAPPSEPAATPPRRADDSGDAGPGADTATEGLR